MVIRAAVQVVEGAWWAGIDVVQIGTTLDGDDAVEDYYESVVVEVYAAPAVVDDYYLQFEVIEGEVLHEELAHFTAVERAFFAAGEALLS